MKDSTLVVLIVVCMIVLLIVAISVLWFFFYAQNKIMHLKLREQEITIEHQKKLLLNTVRTQENERNRISAELHDDVGSTLNVINLSLHLLKRKMEPDSDANKIFDQIDSSLSHCIDQTRVMSHNLMPPMLRKFGFHHAMNELIDAVNLNGLVKVRVENEHLVILKDDLKQLHLFRILQELISNTIKYANASEIEIDFNFSEADKLLTMRYVDNGIGFDPEAASSGLGISNLNTRAELLGGEAKFSKQNEKRGICFTLKFPIDE